jgi:hypothetical protein
MFIANTRFDPRDGDNGLDELRRNVERYRSKGLKLYTAEWNNGSRGYKLSDPACYRFLEKHRNSASRTSTCTRARRSGRWTRTRSTCPTWTTPRPTSLSSTSSSSTYAPAHLLLRPQLRVPHGGRCLRRGHRRTGGALGDLRAQFLRKAIMAGTDTVCRPLMAHGALPAEVDSPLLIDPATGKRIAEDVVPLHLGKARVTRAGFEANTSICSGVPWDDTPETADYSNKPTRPYAAFLSRS